MVSRQAITKWKSNKGIPDINSAEVNMLGIYFSATGNTKYCVERLVKELDENSKIISMEDAGILTAIQNSDSFVFGYGVKFSNVPKIVHNWILTNKRIFNGKKVLIVATMGAFSRDSAGCAARLFRKCGAEIIGVLHIRMPDVVSDEKMLINGHWQSIRRLLQKPETKSIMLHSTSSMEN